MYRLAVLLTASLSVLAAENAFADGALAWSDGDWTGGTMDRSIDVISVNSPFAALSPEPVGDEQTSIVYDPRTGELGVNAPVDRDLTSINIDSAAGIFTGAPAQNLGGSFDNDTDWNLFKATFGSSFGSFSFGPVAQSGLAEDFVLNDLTVIGSLAGGGDLGDVGLIYVPEPSTFVLLGVGLGMLVAVVRRQRRK